jgi:hypothetical protein
MGRMLNLKELQEYSSLTLPLGLLARIDLLLFWAQVWSAQKLARLPLFQLGNTRSSPAF